MSLGDKNKLNRIEELKSKLFSKSFKQKTERHTGFLMTENKDIPDSWEDENKSNVGTGERFFMRSSLFKNFFIFSIVFFVLAVGYASYMFFVGGNTVSNDNIELSVLGNTFVAGGEELSLQVGVVNKNSSPLELVDLIVEYPKNGGGTPQDLERFRESMGLIPAGAVKNQNLKLVLFGEQGSTRKIKISVEYRVGGSNAIFVKEKFYEVTLNSSPVDLAVDAPTEISPNQNITLNIKTTLNSTRAATDMLLRVDYPVGFQFVSSDVEPSFGNDVWSLGDLAPGVERNVSISGKMIDVFDGEEKTFRVWVGSKSSSDKSVIDIVFNSLGYTLTVKKPFIEAKLLVNGVYRSEYASDTKTFVTSSIKWVNNLDTKVNDLEIRAKLSGNALNRKGISTDDGFYDSAKDTIVWNKNFTKDFAEVEPGASGTVTFSILPLSSNLISVLNDPLVNIEVSISGKQSQEGNTLKELKNSESKIIRIISDVGFATKALYYGGPFKNEGPIPPQAEKETTYTIVWTITNTTNNISKTQVKTTLPPWANFIGTISPLAEDINWNATTKELIWDVGKVSKGTGISSGSKEVSFQISFSPSLSQVDTSPTLINDTTLTGFDDFAKVNIRVNKQSLSTILSNDPEVPNTGYRVVE